VRVHGAIIAAVDRETPARGEITGLLIAWRSGDRAAFDRLFGLLYDELRLLARRQLRRSGRDQTLDTTSVLHEAYLRLVDPARAGVEDRGHFLALASRAMRHILVDAARRRGARKRGAGDLGRLDGDPEDPGALPGEDLVALDAALQRLEAVDARLGRVVELRYFGGLSVEEAAEAMATSPRTVKRDWVKARAFLFHELRSREP
jgi:RNA polymerase sigma factor (TIGR02999 family)